MAQALWYDHVLDACTMEALVCRDGLRMAMQYGQQRILLETDCFELVRLWTRKENQQSTIGPILQEIEDLNHDEFSM